MRVLASIVAVPVLLFGWIAWSDHSFEHRLQPIASAIAGRPVAVDCQGFLRGLVDVQSREGEVRFDANGVPEPRILLTRPSCRRLQRLSARARHRELDCLTAIGTGAAEPIPLPCYREASPTIYAVLVLAHESYHTRGVVDEATANCLAIQSMAWAAHELGADEDEAMWLALGMAVLEPRQDPPYATTFCRPGTALDLHPEPRAFLTERPLAPPSARSSH